MATQNSTRHAHNFIDLTGQEFCLWTVLGLAEVRKGYGAFWLCRCQCGTERIILGKCLRRGSTKTCGCRPAGLKHGLYRTRSHMCWTNMLQRCTNPVCPTWKNYGARGITVCKRWLTFENFYADMGNPPTAKHSIDRIDNNGNYEPANCHWATKQEQCNNSRQNHLLTFQGRTQTLTQWAKETGLGIDRLRSRIRNSWSAERALTQPAQHHKTRL